MSAASPSVAQGGSIINISTAVARIMFEQHMACMGAKAGMDHVVRAVANECGCKAPELFAQAGLSPARPF
jgi:NAD(P)-dependent dehydrogenase (short-subunit alcohol dehydrogenase family)